MYQGKFDKKKKGTGVSIEEIVASRNASGDRREAAPERAPRREAPAEAPKKRAPIQEQPQAQKTKPDKSRPVREEPVQEAPRKRGPRLGSVIFYTIYCLFIFLFFVGTFFGLQWLKGWLADYEAAQPTTKSQEVFQQLFADPDWGELYDAAGITDTQYEGRDAFVTYMEELVGDGELSFNLTSSGLSKDKKYFVTLDGKRVAYFTLHNANKSESQTDIPDWNLQEVGLFYERANGYRIETVDGHIPYVNGVALTDDHIIQIAGIKEDTSGFLPVGISTTKTCTYEITDLIATPVITVKDSTGKEMEVVYDETTDTFIEQTEVIAISDEERELALNALKVYARYGIKEATGAEVGKYFDSTGEAYKSIMQTVLAWTKGNNGISFDKDTVTDYCRYSDTLFSVYVTTELTIKLTDGGTQTKTINSTLLFSKQGGSWKVIKMTNANIIEPVGRVRLTFMNEAGDQVISSEFYAIDSETLDAPAMSAPEGKVFSGWVREDIKPDGTKTLTLVFIPDETGSVALPSDNVLEPMVLYPLFEAAATE